MNSQNSIKWHTLEEAQKLNNKEPRKIMVEVYTDWCTWCSQFENKTLTHPHIVQYINATFYAVRINPEKLSKINWKDEEYLFKESGKRVINEWFILHAQGHLSFPSLIFFDENLNTIQNIPGYHDEVDMARIINYFGSNAYKNTPWVKYTQVFNPYKFLKSK